MSLEHIIGHVKNDTETPSLVMPMKSTYSAESKEPTVKQFNGAKTIPVAEALKLLGRK